MTLSVTIALIILFRIFLYVKNIAEENILAETTEKKLKYVTNGNEKITPFWYNYYTILDISHSTLMCPEVVSAAYDKQIEFYKEREILGMKNQYSISDFKAAKSYLNEYYGYASYLN
jgi:hypothetical protein